MTLRAEAVFSAEQVVTALYRGMLNRAPDPQGLSDHLRQLDDATSLTELVRQFVQSPEFEANRSAPANVSDRFPPNPIQFDLADEQRELLWRHIAEAWSGLGQQDPYFSVLTAEEFRRDNLSAAAIERFYASGEGDVLRAEAYLARHGLQLPRDGVCVDYGCGLGRISLWLARRCKRVLAVDVSEAHLAVARQALAQRGAANVDFRLLRRRGDLSILQGADFFHSVIVLQHNPPAIIADILQHAFDGLNPGGCAFFQVPTYGLGYSWDFERYVRDRLPHADIEMHVLPQSAVFRAAARAGCLPVEVQPDGCIGDRGWISNTFLFVKPDVAASRPARGAADAGGRRRRLIPLPRRRRTEAP